MIVIKASMIQLDGISLSKKKKLSKFEKWEGQCSKIKIMY